MMTIEEVIKESLEYREGRLYWKSCSKPRFNGKPAGCKEPLGYLVVKVGGKVYKAHRVIWLLHYGSWPDSWVDHIDGDKENNQIENLRVVDFSQSNANRIKTSNKKLSKYKGVSKNKHYTWKATIQDKFLGCFATEEEAALAYNKAAVEIFGEYAKLNNLERYEDDF